MTRLIKVRDVDDQGRSVSSWAEESDVVTSSATPVSVLSQTVVLNNDDILAIVDTPYPVLPAPGAGKMLLPLFVIVTVDARAGAYTNIGESGAICFTGTGSTHPQYAYWKEDPANSYPLIAADQAEKITEVFGLRSTQGGLGDVSSGLEDKGFWIRFSNESNFTGGNAANTLSITVLYMVVDI